MPRQRKTYPDKSCTPRVERAVAVVHVVRLVRQRHFQLQPHGHHDVEHRQYHQDCLRRSLDGRESQQRYMAESHGRLHPHMAHQRPLCGRRFVPEDEIPDPCLRLVQSRQVDQEDQLQLHGQQPLHADQILMVRARRQCRRHERCHPGCGQLLVSFRTDVRAGS